MLSLHLLPSAECIMKASKKNLDFIATQIPVLQNICLMRVSMLQQVQSINQSINQSISQSVSQSVSQPINQSVSQSVTVISTLVTL